MKVEVKSNELSADIVVSHHINLLWLIVVIRFDIQGIPWRIMQTATEF